MEIERERPKETELPFRRARIFFVRHGEPLEYGADTSLTDHGIEQVKKFADYFAAELMTDERKKIVKILRSDRKRTDETAEVVARRLHEGIRRGELNSVTAKENIRKRHFVTPSDTLDPVIASGVPLEDAYRVWLSLGYTGAREIGAKWSGDIAREAFQISRLLGDFVGDTPLGPDLYYVLATHETTLGAILKHSSLGEVPIGYAQHVEIESRGELMQVSFGETVTSGKKTDFDWQITQARLTS